MLLISFATCSGLLAQRLSYDYYAIREGLGNRLVQDIEFDSLGLVWVATGNGLYRFDGYDFVGFSDAESTEQGYYISQTKVKDIAIATDNRLILFYEDLYTTFDFIDPITFEVEKVEVSLQIDGQARNLFANRQGEIFVVSKGKHFTGVYQYNYATKEFIERFRLDEKWDRQYPVINLLVTDQGDALLYDQEHGLRRCLAQTDSCHYFDFPMPMTGDDPLFMPMFFQDLESRIWLSYQNQAGIFQLNVENNKLSLLRGIDNRLMYSNVWEDDAGNLIFNQAGNTGNFPLSQQLFCLSKRKEIIDFSHLLEVSTYVLKIRSKDFFRTLFFGTDTGLKVAQNTTTRFERYLSQQIGEDRRGFSMRGICEDTLGNVYFAREVEHWYRLNQATNVIDTLRLQDKFGKFLEFNNCQGIWYDKLDYLWGVTGDGTNRTIGMLHRYDIANCNTMTYEYPLSFTSYTNRGGGQFAFGGRSDDNRGELVFFDTLSSTFSHFVDKNGYNPFEKNYIRYILPKGEDQLWVGTEQGLFEVDINQKTYRHFTKANTEDGLSDNLIFALFQHPNDKLWVGTLNGLSSYDPNTGSWKHYDTQDGLASNTIAAILPGQEEGSLWVSTYDGLSFFKPDSDQSRQFFQIDGLSHNEFNRFSALKTSNGRCFLGGVNGINAFSEDEILVRRNIPKVLLTSFEHYDTRLDSTVVHTAGVLQQQEIVVEPHHDYFSLDFALPIYTPTTNNEFRYRIGNQADQDWVSLKGDRSLRFNDMKAGSYKLYIQGADANGTWSRESLALNLTVKEKFYNRIWFQGLLILLGLGGIFIIARYRLEEKLRMERLRTQLASDLHDEVSGLLAGISMQSELLRDKIKDPTLDEKLGNIRQASQLAMSKMSDVIWSIDSRRDRVSDLISRMEEHADEVLLPLDIRYKLNTSQLDSNQAIPANIRQNIYFIYKEAINNVAKHSKANLVDIRIGHHGPLFELVIKDNGIGEPKTNGVKKRSGQGLSNLKMRAQRLNAQIDIMNARGFTIHLRMKRFL